jgi:hypothetical protein
MTWFKILKVYYYNLPAFNYHLKNKIIVPMKFFLTTIKLQSLVLLAELIRAGCGKENGNHCSASQNDSMGMLLVLSNFRKEV